MTKAELVAYFTFLQRSTDEKLLKIARGYKLGASERRQLALDVVKRDQSLGRISTMYLAYL